MANVKASLGQDKNSEGRTISFQLHPNAVFKLTSFTKLIKITGSFRATFSAYLTHFLVVVEMGRNAKEHSSESTRPHLYANHQAECKTLNTNNVRVIKASNFLFLTPFS